MSTFKGQLKTSSGDILYPQTSIDKVTGFPTTSAGDLIYGGTGGELTTLAAGTDGQILKSSNGAPQWGANIPEKTQGIFYAQVDSTSTSTNFTVTIPELTATEYYDGLTLLLYNGKVTSASGFTINVNGLGAKPSYSNMALGNPVTPTDPTRDTTIFNINYAMLFTYNSTRVSGGCWICYRGYDANTNTIGYQVRTNNSTLKASDKFYRYRLLFTSADGTKWVPANTSTSTNATSARNVNQRPIDPFGEITWYGTTTAIEANANVTAAQLWQQYYGTYTLIGYSFNNTGAAATMTANRPIYIKCTPQSNGSAIIDANTPYVQTLPSTDDGKIYIFLGRAVSATAFEILLNHPVYYHKDGAIRVWTNPADSGMANPMTSLGDMIYGDAGADPIKLSIGTSGQVLTSDGSIPYWATPATPATVGTLDTTATTAQTTSASESFSNNITLHKVSKTGSYNDLNDKPTIPVDTNTTYTLNVSGTGDNADKVGLVAGGSGSGTVWYTIPYATSANTANSATTAGSATTASTADVANSVAWANVSGHADGVKTDIGMTAAGDIIYGGIDGTPTALSVASGDVGKVLTVWADGLPHWDTIHVDTIKNDLTLLKQSNSENPNPGDSYALIFQRGTLTDSYNDWRIQDRGGFLYFDQRGSGSTSWSNQAYINTSGTLYATTFSGSGASLTSLNASNISSGTINVARLPSITSAKISDFTTAARGAISGTSPISYDSSTGAISHATSLSAAVTSGLYKIAADTYGHITSTTAVEKADITGLGIPGSDTNTTYTLNVSGTGDNANKLGLTAGGSGSGTTWVTIPYATTSGSANSVSWSNVSGHTAGVKADIGMTTLGDIIHGDADGNPMRLGIGTAGQVLISDGNVPTWGSVATSGISSGSATSGYVLTADGSGGVSWAAGGGSGTVTSVDGSGSGGISVTGGPITSSGTLSVSVDSSHKLLTTTEWGTVVTATQNNNVSVAGSTKTTYTYDKTTIFAPNGLIMGGTAAAAGLVTRGVCGVTTPNSTTGAATKDNLFLNYDGDNTYRNSRQIVIQAGAVGTHYGSNVYQYCAVRGDALKGWIEGKFPNTTTANKVLLSTTTNGTTAWSSWSTAGLLKTNTSGVVSVDTNTYITNPLTTAGDIFVGGTSGAPDRLGIGSNNNVLQVASGALSWGGVSSASIDSTGASSGQVLTADGSNGASWQSITHPSDIFEATYGTTSYYEILNAASAGKICIVKYSELIYELSYNPLASGVMFTCVNNGVEYTVWVDDTDTWGNSSTNIGTVKKVNNTSPDANGNVSITIPTYNFSGTTFYSGNQNTAEHNANNMTKNGVYYIGSSQNGPPTTLGVQNSDSSCHVQAYNDSWVTQLAQDYRDGQIFVRAKKNNVWQNWMAVPFFTTSDGGKGSPTKPVYISNQNQSTSGSTNGQILECTYSLEANVPSNAVFTDTNQTVKTSSVTFSGDDAVEFVGSNNITVTGDASAKTITIGGSDIYLATYGTTTFVQIGLAILSGQLCGVEYQGDVYTISNATGSAYTFSSVSTTSVKTVSVNSSNVWSNQSAPIGGSSVFVATYGTTTYADIVAAYTANKICIVNYNELTYMLSQPDTVSAQLDFTAVANDNLYTISVLSNNTWSNSWVRVVKSVNNVTPSATGNVTIPALPTVTSADAGKILTVDSNGNWVAATMAQWTGGNY